MSDRLLGEAGAAGGAAVGSNGAGGLAGDYQENGYEAAHEPGTDEVAVSGEGTDDLGSISKARRRRRGSRGGRGRRSGAAQPEGVGGSGTGAGAASRPTVPEVVSPASAMVAAQAPTSEGLPASSRPVPTTALPAAGQSPAPSGITAEPAASAAGLTAEAAAPSAPAPGPQAPQPIGPASSAGAPPVGYPAGSSPAARGAQPGSLQGASPVARGEDGPFPAAGVGGPPAATPVAPSPATGLGGAPSSAPTQAPTAVGPPASAAAGEVRKPKIGDTRPGSPPLPRRRANRQAPLGHAGLQGTGTGDAPVAGANNELAEGGSGPRQRRPRRRRAGTAEGRGPGALGTSEAAAGEVQGQRSAPALQREVGQRPVAPGPAPRSRRGDRHLRPLGRYLMVVHVGPTATQIAVLEGRTLIEHYVSRPADDTTQIDGNIYLGRVQNVLPGMEAAFVDIGTPKNAVLYRGDLRYDEDEVAPASDDDVPGHTPAGPGKSEEPARTELAGPGSASKPTRGRLPGAARDARIEQLLHTGQNIICQVTKNPIGTKGARLTQEVSLPGRFVVLVPDSDTYGISKRLPDEERRRLRKILDEVRPEGHGLIVRTAAEGASADELARDVSRLLGVWENVQSLARVSRAPQLLYREPDLAVRVIREEFNRDYRGVVIDDPKLYAEVKDYVTEISPDLAERVELVDPREEPLPLFERFRIHEQIHKALDRKVWLPSGGSIIIERTEALTVIDVNTGKNVGTSNLEETVFRNNLEAAEEIARQLRLRDIGGIIVIDFIDMEIPANRAEVVRTFREVLARDKTRTQVFDISELGLVEMTRKRVSEGLVESYSETCPTCGGRGIVFDESLLG